MTPISRIAVIGCRGMLGSEVVRRVRSLQPEIEIAEFDLPELDITSPDSLHGCRELHEAQVIINCAAYTDVERAEAEENLAVRINAQGVANLAQTARANKAMLMHLSTDFVFDGTRRTPYPVDSAPTPICAYGRSKLAGEVALQESGCDFCLVRTAWLFGPGGRNFVETILLRGGRQERLPVVSDQRGSPTCTIDLADVLLDLALHRTTGFFHCTNSGVCSWFEFACEIVRLAGLKTRVEPISSAEAALHFDLKAARPAYSALDCGRLEATTGRRMRPWQDALAEYILNRRTAI